MFILAEIKVLVSGAIPPPPAVPTNSRMKRVQGHVLPVKCVADCGWRVLQAFHNRAHVLLTHTVDAEPGCACLRMRPSHRATQPLRGLLPSYSWLAKLVSVVAYCAHAPPAMCARAHARSQIYTMRSGGPRFSEEACLHHLPQCNAGQSGAVCGAG